MHDIPYKLLSLCIEASPTGKEQAAFSRMYNEMRKDGETAGGIIKQLANALSDGLSFGNWPQ